MDIYEHRRKRLVALIRSQYKVRKNIADLTGFSEARISQILSPTYRGGRAFSEKVARKLEEDLGLTRYYFDDPSLPTQKEEVENSSAEPVAPEVVFVPLCTISVRDDVPTVDAVSIVTSGRQFAPYFGIWLREIGINYYGNAALFKAPDDSMTPRFTTDDVVLVDRGDTDVSDGRMYVIRYGKSVKIRLLSRRLDGSLTLRSLNPSYPDEHLSGEQAKEHITVIGRIREIKAYSNL